MTIEGLDRGPALRRHLVDATGGNRTLGSISDLSLSPRDLASNQRHCEAGVDRLVAADGIEPSRTRE